MTKFERQCEILQESRTRGVGVRKQGQNVECDGDELCPPKLKQAKIDRPQFLTQANIDEYVMEYIVDNVLSLHHVDTPGFKKFVKQCTHLYPRCRQTLTHQLEKRFLNVKEDLKAKLASVDYVCTTADCWTSRRRGFIGITVHWLDTNLTRKSACLAVRQIKGRHTYDVLAQVMEAVNIEFGIEDKVCFTVTDSGANFLKAFKHFSMEESRAVDASGTFDEAQSHADDADDGNDGDNDDNDDMQFVEITDILQPSAEDDEQVVYRLPPHRKCACHLLNLVACHDTNNISGMCKKVSVQTFGKLTALWNKQNRSVTVADNIRDSLGCLLVTPGATRWNSTYDAMCKVDTILSNSELEGKFDQLCDDLGIKRLLPVQKTFVKEYVKAMAPLCAGLDVLQGDKTASLSYLLPTLTEMKNRLQELISDSNGNNQLNICSSLVQVVLAGLETRFGDTFNDASNKLAAVVDPKFKLDWLDDEGLKIELTTMLKNSVAAMARPNRQPVQESSVATASSAASSAANSNSSNFFARLAAKRSSERNPDDCSQEVDKYLADPSSEVQSLQTYPNVRKLYMKLNTGLPSSASVERLFSLGGRVFTPMRSRLSSSHFEMMVFMRAYKSSN